MSDTYNLQTIAVGTMRGDTRDAMLQELRGGPLKTRAYGDLTEAEQVAVATRIDDYAVHLITQLYELVASQGEVSIKLDFNGYNAGPKGLRATLTCASTQDNRDALSELIGGEVMVLSADVRHSMGERKPVLIRRDQPEIFEGASNGHDVEVDQTAISYPASGPAQTRPDFVYHGGPDIGAIDRMLNPQQHSAEPSDNEVTAEDPLEDDEEYPGSLAPALKARGRRRAG